MYNPTRRNRNIGTENQGFGQNNKNVISSKWSDLRIFWEKLEQYTVVRKKIKEKEYKFLIEKTRLKSVHPCTVDDIARMICFLDSEDLEGLDLIVFRQPKRREETLSPVWGRLNYFVEIDKNCGPAIMLDASDFERKIKWSKSLKTEEREEFERLCEDGHKMIENKRGYTIFPTIEGLRNTILYRTFIHEVGHYVEYLEKVKKPSMQQPDKDCFNNWEDYDRIPAREKEKFAHAYAKKKMQELKEKKLIPFDRILDLESLEFDKLSITDFVIDKE